MLRGRGDGRTAMLFTPENHVVQPLEDATPLLGDSEALQAAAAERGYLFLPGLVPPDLLARLRARVRAICASFGWFLDEPDDAVQPIVRGAPGVALAGRGFDDPRFVALQQRLNATDELRALGEVAEILRVLSIVLGEPAAAALSHFCWVKMPGSPQHTTLPHQDAFYVPQIPDLWTAWFPVVDTPTEVGPLGVVPGSHKQGLWPHESALAGIKVARDVVWASNAVVAGDVLLFGALTIHGAWANVSPDRVRVSADVRFLRASSGFVL